MNSRHICIRDRIMYFHLETRHEVIHAANFRATKDYSLLVTFTSQSLRA